MIWPFIIFAITFVAKMAFDLWQFYRKRKINHTAEAAVVAILLAVAALIMTRYNGEFHPRSALLPFVMFLFVFWAGFDSAWNLFRNNKIGYVGEKAWLDRMQRKYPALKVVKFAGGILSLLFFILTYGLLLFELPIYG